MENKTVKVNDEEFVLDTDRLTFNEASLSKYLQEEAAWYNHVAQKLADAEQELQEIELEYDIKYSEKFRGFKELGGSDKLAESNSKADVEVEALKQFEIKAKNTVKSLQWYLKALDKSHDNAQSFGHMLRKEMDKLMMDIKRTGDVSMESQIDDIIGRSNG